jgi:hypothetical protein
MRAPGGTDAVPLSLTDTLTMPPHVMTAHSAIPESTDEDQV